LQNFSIGGVELQSAYPYLTQLLDIKLFNIINTIIITM
jgi:hypothetical protein